jgi:hypothetical protein
MTAVLINRFFNEESPLHLFKSEDKAKKFVLNFIKQSLSKESLAEYERGTDFNEDWDYDGLSELNAHLDGNQADFNLTIYKNLKN